MKTFTVSRLVELTGVGTETVRFYERRNLLPEPVRNASGYRQYSRDDVARLVFIRHAKELGFTLREIKQLINLKDDPETTRGNIQVVAQHKIHNLSQQIASLTFVNETLTRLLESSLRTPASDACPLMEYLTRDSSPE